jgi:hypothetical protein
LVIETELENAERARLAGKEGRARVCARRAAGLAARNYLERHGVQLHDRGAYAALQILAEYPGISADLRLICQHLTTRVTESFTLPLDVDLIIEARTLIGGLE